MSGFRGDSDGVQGCGDGFGLEHHAFAAAEGSVIDRAVTVVGKGAQIVDAYLDETLGERTAQDAVFKDAREEAGKDGDDLKAHTSR